MSDAPLMPMATAVWLVENTTLTFKQIAEFCKLHEVEVQGIADGEVAKGIKAYNPIISGQLSREEIEMSSKDTEKKLSLLKKVDEVEIKERKKPKYTPLSKRQDRPDAILWLCKNLLNSRDDSSLLVSPFPSPPLRASSLADSITSPVPCRTSRPTPSSPTRPRAGPACRWPTRRWWARRVAAACARRRRCLSCQAWASGWRPRA